MRRTLRFSATLLSLSLITSTVIAQEVGISANGAVPNPDAMLDISVASLGIKQGMLIPRMTRAQRNAIVAPANGLWVYQTDDVAGETHGLWYYDAVLPAWVRLATGDGWKLGGDVGLATNFVGTTDAQPFVIRTNNVERMRILATGQIGIGTTTPTEAVQVNGAVKLFNAASNSLTNQAGVIRYNTTTNYHQGNVDGTAAGWEKIENAFREVIGDDYEGTILQCGSGSAEIAAQNGQSTGNNDTPFPTLVGRGSKVQYLFRQSELTSFGLCPGNITEIAFRVLDDDVLTPAPGAAVNIEIRIGATAAGTLNMYDPATSASVVRGTLTNWNVSSGWMAITLTTPYNWNGINNLIVDVSYIRAATFGNSPRVLLTTGLGFNGTRYGYDAGPTPGSAFNDAPANPATATFGTQTSRAVIRFTGQANVPVPIVSTGDYALYTGGLLVGTPAWASGAGIFQGPGVIRAQNGVYDGNIQLSDHVFDLYFDGKVLPEDDHKAAAYEWVELGDLRDHLETNRHLPTMPSRTDWQTNGKYSLGELQSKLWESVETQALYIAELEQDIDRIEAQILANGIDPAIMNKFIAQVKANAALTDEQKDRMIGALTSAANKDRTTSSK